jgi:hypothetical protein
MYDFIQLMQGGLLDELDQDMDTTQSRLKATQKKMQVCFSWRLDPVLVSVLIRHLRSFC